MTNQDYIKSSIEVNLFFHRIMKEHLFFIQTNLQPVAGKYIKKANELKRQFEQLLCKTLYYANGIVSKSSVISNEFVTPYTLKAEERNAMLTGTGINTRITKMELNLPKDKISYSNPNLLETIYKINNSSICILSKTISFQRHLLTQASNCQIFISLYPQMLEHDICEAEHYFKILEELLNYQISDYTLCDELHFWNTIMSEHARFIDGMLNPNELNLKETAENIAREFELLANECTCCTEEELLQNSLHSTKEIKMFKISTTEGLLECRIKSVIPPLLADHILREANHYLRLLKSNNC